VQPWWHMMLFTVQREQAQRFIAEPGSKMRGANTVVLSYHARMERIIDLPPQAFYPMPRVSSSVVRFVPRQGPRAVNYRLFRRIVRAGFDMRRKTLVNSLSRGLALPRIRVQQVLASSGIEVRRRAEELDVLDFIRLTKALSDSSEVSGETALISPEIRPEGSNGKR